MRKKNLDGNQDVHALKFVSNGSRTTPAPSSDPRGVDQSPAAARSRFRRRDTSGDTLECSPDAQRAFILARELDSGTGGRARALRRGATGDDAAVDASHVVRRSWSLAVWSERLSRTRRRDRP